MSLEKVKVPDLGDAGEVEVIEVLVKVGQTVAKDDSLIVLESDKAAMEIPSPMAGVVKAISINVGDQVKQGSEILSLEVESGGAKAETADSGKEKAETQRKDLDQNAESAGAGKNKDEKPKKDPDPKSEKATGKTESDPAESKVASGTSSDKPAAAVTEEIRVPDLGGESEVEVIEVHVAEGAEVAVEESLITLESDKAAMDVPSPKAGKVKSMKLKVGDKVSAGTLILEMEVQQTSAPAAEKAAGSAPEPAAKTEREPAAASAPAAAPSPARAPAAASESSESPEDGEAIYAGPAVRKLARELGVKLSAVKGTGGKGRILKEDVLGFVKSQLTAPVATSGSGAGIIPVPDQDFSQFGEIEQVPLSKLHRITAVNMHRNWTNVPHVAQFNEADVTELEAFRLAHRAEADKRGVKLTFLPFLLKACARALQEYPQFNVSLHSSGEYLIQKKYIHIGVAVATEAGLVVPVVRNVDQKNIWQLAAETAELSDKAKQRRLTRDDMQGACFSISSLGALGGTGFIPIVNAPEVAILGVSKTAMKPVYIDGGFIPRNMLPLTLSYDHRAVNGVDGGLFATYLAKLLGDIRLLLL